MKVMTLNRLGRPLVLEDRPDPTPGPGQLLLDVKACAVCRTDLHVVDGDLPGIPLPIVPGHEIVGEVIRGGEGTDCQPGQRLGIPWLGHTCGACHYCESERENLCDEARFTGYQIDGGFAEKVVADARFCFPITDRYDAVEAAPLLCAGLIGYRSLRMAGDAQDLGIFGFGAAAHIVAQVAAWQGRRIFAFTRPGDTAAQDFAMQLGAVWAGGSGESPDCELDAALIFAPVGSLVPRALSVVKKGGTVVCGGIHMSDIPAFPYSILWGERSVRSVANLTRRDATEFLDLAPRIPVRTHTTTYALEQANEALADLREGRLNGAAVLVP